MAKILIVEDNLLNRELTSELLEIHGYTVMSTRSGEEALALAVDYMPDLILLDLSLPGISGLAVVRALKADPELVDIPVIAVTAHVMKGDQERALEVGCCAYISKPIDARNFLASVERHLY
jgi:two-component system cell cycle response regulator DivK